MLMVLNSASTCSECSKSFRHNDFCHDMQKAVPLRASDGFFIVPCFDFSKPSEKSPKGEREIACERMTEKQIDFVFRPAVTARINPRTLQWTGHHTAAPHCKDSS